MTVPALTKTRDDSGVSPQGYARGSDDHTDFNNLRTWAVNHETASAPHSGHLTGDSPTITTPTVNGGTLNNMSKMTCDHYAATRKVLTDGATIAIDWDNGNIQYVELTDVGRTVTFSNPLNGGRYVFIIKQDSTGSRTITTWPTIVWVGGSAPTLTTTAEHYDIVSLLYDGTNYYGTYTLDLS